MVTKFEHRTFVPFGHYFLDNRSIYYLDFIQAHRGLRVHYAGEKSPKLFAGKVEFF